MNLAMIASNVISDLSPPTKETSTKKVGLVTGSDLAPTLYLAEFLIVNWFFIFITTLNFSNSYIKGQFLSKNDDRQIIIDIIDFLIDDNKSFYIYNYNHR